MAQIGGSGGLRGEPADGQEAASPCELVQERAGRHDLRLRGPPVRGRRAGMGRDDVPAEGLQLQFGERPLDDRRRRLGRAAAGEVTLRRERDPRDTRPAVTGGLADEEQLRPGMRFEIVPQPLPP